MLTVEAARLPSKCKPCTDPDRAPPHFAPSSHRGSLSVDFPQLRKFPSGGAGFEGDLVTEAFEALDDAAIDAGNGVRALDLSCERARVQPQPRGPLVMVNHRAGGLLPFAPLVAHGIRLASNSPVGALRINGRRYTLSAIREVTLKIQHSDQGARLGGTMLFRLASVLVLPLIASMSVGGALNWAQAPPFPPPASAAARPTDPGNLLRDFQTYYIRSQTPFIRPELLLKACADRADFAAWNLSAVEEDREAEVVVEVDLPPLSWEWKFKMIERASGRVLVSGSVRALEQRQAAPLLAAEISRQIQSVRGIPQVQATPVSQPVAQQARLQSWRVTGGPGPFQGQAMTLTLGAESILLNGSSAERFEIPIGRVLSAYDFVPQTKERDERVESWDKGWDKVCYGIDPNGECYPLVFGAPIWLLGGAILSQSLPGTHFVVVRWRDGQSVAELSVRPESSEWKDILQQLQALLGKNQREATLEADRLRRQFEGAKQTDLRVYLESTVQIGRWPPLHGPNRYRMIVLERDNDRAEVFFFDLGDPRLVTPLAVAVAHFERVPHTIATITVRLRESDKYRVLDQIRYEDVVLQFASDN